MVTEFSTMGSCASRIIFNSIANEGYKEFFHINRSLEVVSLISLMSKPINYDETLLDSMDKFDNECVANDLSKNFLNFLKKNSIEYLLIDTYFDVESNIIIFDENTYLTDSGRLHRTAMKNLFCNKRRINPFNNFNEFMELWKNACNLFFEFLSKNCPNIKVVLNCSRGALYYLDENNNKIKFNNAKYIDNSNKLRDILEIYLLDNFDIEVLPFDETILAFKNHFAQLHTVHYENKYYKDKTKQLNNIIERNKSLGFDNTFNKSYRQILRENIINKFKLQNDWLNLKYRSGNICDKLNKYNTARIDIKNSGIKTNSVKIIDISDQNCFYHYPTWFENIQGEGKGLVIESSQNFLDITLQCKGNGLLYITLRGVDFQVEGERIPIYINYTKLNVNGINIFEKNKQVCHDKSFTIQLPVKNEDYVNIILNWLPSN